MSNNYCLIKNKNNVADGNGYGSIDFSFLIQQNFITYQEYIDFLNTLGSKAIDLNIYHIDNPSIEYNQIFRLKNNIDPYLPVTYINLINLQQYCNWLNHHDINYINEYPYNIDNNSLTGQYEYWIPTYDEFYKAAYYNPYLKQYNLFPNNNNSIENFNIDQNHISPYGLINAGFKYFNILYDNKNLDTNKYLIAGGSYNRHPINAKAGTKYYVSMNYMSNYISARLCKKCPTHNLSIKLYDTYGDGWQNNHIAIKDSSHKTLLDNASLEHGYGPHEIKLEIDTLEKYIYIEYIQNNEYHYENYYEVYLNNECIFKSEVYETPPKLTKIPIKT